MSIYSWAKKSPDSPDAAVVLSAALEALEAAEVRIRTQNELIEAYNDLAIATGEDLAQITHTWQTEIISLNTQAETNARLISAYRKWCAEKKCVPTAADLARLADKPC